MYLCLNKTLYGVNNMKDFLKGDGNFINLVILLLGILALFVIITYKI